MDNLIFRKINQFARENDVEQATPMHGWIIGYLYRHRDTPVFQRDIEREFSITRSTVTNILQLMERKGYIERRSVPQDARLKQLVLTEEGICFHERRCSASTRPTTMWPEAALSSSGSDQKDGVGSFPQTRNTGCGTQQLLHPLALAGDPTKLPVSATGGGRCCCKAIPSPALCLAG